MSRRRNKKVTGELSSQESITTPATGPGHAFDKELEEMAEQRRKERREEQLRRREKAERRRLAAEAAESRRLLAPSGGRDSGDGQEQVDEVAQATGTTSAPTISVDQQPKSTEPEVTEQAEDPLEAARRRGAIPKVPREQQPGQAPAAGLSEMDGRGIVELPLVEKSSLEEKQPREETTREELSQEEAESRDAVRDLQSVLSESTLLEEAAGPLALREERPSAPEGEPAPPVYQEPTPETGVLADQVRALGVGPQPTQEPMEWDLDLPVALSGARYENVVPAGYEVDARREEELARAGTAKKKNRKKKNKARRHLQPNDVVWGTEAFQTASGEQPSVEEVAARRREESRRRADTLRRRDERNNRQSEAVANASREDESQRRAATQRHRSAVSVQGNSEETARAPREEPGQGTREAAGDRRLSRRERTRIIFANRDKYKARGALFGNLQLVELDPTVDPPIKACYNCWQEGHTRFTCPAPVRFSYCYNCGRRNVSLNSCPRCSEEHERYLRQRALASGRPAATQARVSVQSRLDRPALPEPSSTEPLVFERSETVQLRRPISTVATETTAPPATRQVLLNVPASPSDDENRGRLSPSPRREEPANRVTVRDRSTSRRRRSSFDRSSTRRRSASRRRRSSSRRRSPSSRRRRSTSRRHRGSSRRRRTPSSSSSSDQHRRSSRRRRRRSPSTSSSDEDRRRRRHTRRRTDSSHSPSSSPTRPTWDELATFVHRLEGQPREVIDEVMRQAPWHAHADRPRRHRRR